MENIQSKIDSFKSLFKGREDVFAKRWENDAKSGYMPVYFFDPYRLRAHKMKGGRRIILSILTSSGIVSAFDKNSGFDRLFPNQDNL